MEENNQQLGFNVTFQGLSIVLSILGLGVCVYDIINSKGSVVSIIDTAFLLIAFTSALLYMLLGGKKKAAALFKGFLTCFSISEIIIAVTTVYTIASKNQKIFLFLELLTGAFGLIAFMSLIIMAYYKNLGKTNSFVICAIVAVGAIYDIIVGIYVKQFNFPELCILFLAVIMFFAVYSKYKDKATRNSK